MLPQEEKDNCPRAGPVRGRYEWAQVGSMNETVLNLRGLKCPELVLRAKTALRRVSVGSVLVLECTDPLAVIDVPVFVHRAGQTLAAEARTGDLYIFRIVKRR
ncbi:MAG: sulfurtransferase TusA family protein [Alphaproteobacteria bacterium]